MNTTRTNSREELWLLYKSFIRHKYLMEEVPFKELLHLLNDRGLSVTKSQLEYKLRQWKFFKNMKEPEWRFIARMIKRRERIGKSSQVVFNGKLIDRAKVAKETARHHDTLYNELCLQQRSPSPASSMLIVSTPRAFDSLIAWPETLPWLYIRDISWDSTTNILTPSIPGVNAILAPPYGESVSNTLMAVLSNGCLESCAGFPDLSVALHTTMPEWCLGDHTQTIDALTTGSHSAMLPAFLRTMIYTLSNGWPKIGEVTVDAFSSTLATILADNKHDARLLRNKSITFRAFLETLFKLEIYEATSPPPGERRGFVERSLALIKLLLNLGQDPDMLVLGRFSGLMQKPIQVALKCGHVDLVQLLLDANASIDESQERNEKPSAVGAILQNGLSKAEQLRLLKMLDRYRAISPEQVLCGAIQLGDVLLVEQLLQRDIDVTKPHSGLPLIHDIFFKLDFYIGRESPLTISMGTDNDLFKRLLAHPSILSHPAYLTSPEFFIVAAMRGSFETMEYLLKLEPSGITGQLGYLDPLTAAVAYNNLSVARLLLDLGAIKSSHLIFIAAALGNEDMLHLLLHYEVPLNTLDRSGLQSLDCFDTCNAASPWAPMGVIERLLIYLSIGPTEAQVKCLTTLIQAGAHFTAGAVRHMAELGLVGSLEAALSAGADPNERDLDSRTLVQCCLYPLIHRRALPSLTRRQQTITILLKGGAKLVGGEIAKSILDNDMDLTALLLEYSGPLSMINQEGICPFEALIISGPIYGSEVFNDFHFLRSFIEAQGGAVNVGSLCAAIQQENWHLVDYLLLYPFQESKDCHMLEGTAIGLAAKAGHIEILRKILCRITNSPNLQSAFVPLGFPNSSLYEGKYRQTVVNDFWRTNPTAGKPLVGSPLILAALSADTSGFEELLRQGLFPDVPTIAAVAQSVKALDYLRLLRQYCHDFNSLSRPQKPQASPLTIPIQFGKIDLLKQLVEMGIDINDHDVVNFGGRSPLQVAVESGNSEIVHYLLEKGAYVNAPPSHSAGATALQLAAIKGYIGVAKILLEYGAHINARGARYDGRTALEGAAEYGRLDVLEFLLQNGARYTGSGRLQFVSAVRYATDDGYCACVDWLKGNYGWSGEDEDLLNSIRPRLTTKGDYCRNCFPFCCDEIHEDGTDCIYHYLPGMEDSYMALCNECKENERWGEGEKEE
ncbi:hypothetical protein ACLX1H_009228 [Fusarium chlamydosporum]